MDARWGDNWLPITFEEGLSFSKCISLRTLHTLPDWTFGAPVSHFKRCEQGVIAGRGDTHISFVTSLENVLGQHPIHTVEEVQVFDPYNPLSVDEFL